MEDNQPKLETATLGGGCFWCTEAVFSEVRGIAGIDPGYSGGNFPNPSYEDVCSDTTGHAEVVQLTYDPKEISFEDILRVFFSIHDPTTLNRQGNDVGTQYRSIILYHNEEQRVSAIKVIDEVNQSNIWGRKIVTEVVPFDKFYPAEDYHRNYFANNQRQPYCQAVIAPKVSKFRSHYVNLLKKK